MDASEEQAWWARGQSLPLPPLDVSTTPGAAERDREMFVECSACPRHREGLGDCSSRHCGFHPGILQAGVNLQRTQQFSSRALGPVYPRTDAVPVGLATAPPSLRVASHVRCSPGKDSQEIPAESGKPRPHRRVALCCERAEGVPGGLPVVTLARAGASREPRGSEGWCLGLEGACGGPALPPARRSCSTRGGGWGRRLVAVLSHGGRQAWLPRGPFTAALPLSLGLPAWGSGSPCIHVTFHFLLCCIRTCWVAVKASNGSALAGVRAPTLLGSPPRRLQVKCGDRKSARRTATTAL